MSQVKYRYWPKVLIVSAVVVIILFAISPFLYERALNYEDSKDFIKRASGSDIYAEKEYNFSTQEELDRIYKQEWTKEIIDLYNLTSLREFLPD